MWLLFVLVLLAVVVGAILVVVIRKKMKKSTSPSTPRKQTTTASNPASLATRELPPPPSVMLRPSDYNRRVEAWDDAWKLGQVDSGSVEFDVEKSHGLIVTLSTQVGAPRDGYAVVLDERGSGDTDPFESQVSNSYVSRLPQIEGPASAMANARNLKLGGSMRHVRVSYAYGHVAVEMDGQRVLQYVDPAPRPGVQYVGFGHTGLRSGEGAIRNLQFS